ncbi:MAG: DUF2520 domain-containing protein [Calditrichaeota bacterium]|nr:DUF2520 domain-containing protein [Calditrichota bacterium]
MRSNIKQMVNLAYRLYLIGDGNLAHSLAAHYKQRNIDFEWFRSGIKKRYFSSKDELKEKTLYLLAVNESNIADLASPFSDINQMSLYCHFSAAIGIDAFPEQLRKRSFILHPMQTFPSRKEHVPIQNCYFTFQGSKNTYSVLEELFNQIGIQAIYMKMKSVEAYHLTGVFASNFLIALLSVCQRLAAENGLSKDQMLKLIEPLIRQTLHNATKMPLKDALSGPLKRGESNVIKNHEKFNKKFDGELLTLYKVLNDELKKLLNRDK